MSQQWYSCVYVDIHFICRIVHSTWQLISVVIQVSTKNQFLQTQALTDYLRHSHGIRQRVFASCFFNFDKFPTDNECLKQK